MSEKRIKVIIDPYGNAKIEAIGFNGVGCTEATSSLERALGGGTERSFKDEYYTSGEEQAETHQTW